MAYHSFLFILTDGYINLVYVGKGFRKEFDSEYTAHAISQYPFWRRKLYFFYALFLEELEYNYSYGKFIDLIVLLK